MKLRILNAFERAMSKSGPVMLLIVLVPSFSLWVFSLRLWYQVTGRDPNDALPID